MLKHDAKQGINNKNSGCRNGKGTYGALPYAFGTTLGVEAYVNTNKCRKASKNQ